MAEILIKKVTEKYVQGAIDVLRDSFFRDEKVCKCVGLLTESPKVDVDSRYICTAGSLELEALCLDALKDDVSVVAVDEETDQVLGVAFNKIQVKAQPGEKGYFEIFAEKNVKDAAAMAVVDYMAVVDSKLDLFGLCNADCALELTFLGVKYAEKGRGIGRRLVEETIAVAKQYDGFPKPQFVCAIFTSQISQKAGQGAGMEHVLQVPYSEFEHKGKKFSEIIGPDTPVATLSIKKL